MVKNKHLDSEGIDNSNSDGKKEERKMLNIRRRGANKVNMTRR
jgi:hypothetical protein